MSAGQYFTEKGERPSVGKFHGFDHIEFWVGNAYQASAYYVARMGFKRVAYKGLETGSRDVASHVVQQGRMVFVFSSTLKPNDGPMAASLAAHGDGAKDVAFHVDDVRGIYAKAVERGAKSIREPFEMSDEHGTVVLATVQTYGDTWHTFVQRDGYKGVFLPGFAPVDDQDPLEKVTEPVGLQFIDHVVGNQPDGEMNTAVEWYENKLDFHRFWSVDDKDIHTEYSSLRSVVVTDYDEVIKMPINEPAEGRRKSQIQEYVDYYNGAGVQHIAMHTDNIIQTIERMRARGVRFLDVPDKYYDNLRKALADSPTKVQEDLATLQKLKILVDYDENGYLLQIFTKCLEDRPTLFLEVIQRRNHNGFGAGNFKALFEAIERDQAERGNL